MRIGLSCRETAAGSVQEGRFHMEYKKVWRVFNDEGYTIDDGTDGFDTPKEAVEAALNRGYDLQGMIDDSYTVCLVLEDDYTWIEVLDEVSVRRVAEFHEMEVPVNAG